MKRFALLPALVLTLAAAGAAPVHYASHGITFDAPAGWPVFSEQTTLTNAYSILFSPKDDPASMDSMIVQIEQPKARTLPQFVHWYVAQMTAPLPVKISTPIPKPKVTQSKAQPICGGTQPGWLLTVTDGKDVMGNVMLAVKGTRAVSVTFLSHEPATPTVLRALESLCLT